MMKSNLLILGVLGAGCFGLSFGLTWLFGGSTPGPQLATDQQAATQPAVEEPQLMPSEIQVDELVRDLHDKLAQVRRQQRHLEDWEKRLKIAQQDLDKQTEELEALRVQLLAPLNGLKQAREELLRTRISISRAEQAKLKQLALIYDKMDSAASSEILVAMCNNNQIADAVKLLSCMSDRPAAELLGQMEDKALAARLSQMLKTVQEEES